MMKLKFCGFTSIKDVTAASQLPIDAIGFIHYEKSKRHQTITQIKKLASAVPEHIDKVCVVVNPDLTTIEHVLSNTPINTIQLHGTESIDFIQEIKKKYSSIKITKALAADENIIQNINKYKGFVDLFIIDTPSVSYGGTGQTYDWTILKHIKDIPYLIAGGINSENIQTVNQLKLSHQGYDLASGIEVNGRKDIEKMTAIIELKKAYKEAKADPEFQRELEYYLSEYVGRTTPLTYAASYTESLGGAKIYLKREDLNHTGAHKINNALGQALLAKRMGKKKLVAETGAGQHGVASATVAALFDMELVVFMGSEDIKRQQLNVFRMELLGAKVVAVEDGQGTLSDAVNKALQYWVSHVDDTHYLLGSALGPDPFPTIVRDFQSVIGKEIKSQILKKEGRLPDAIVACIGGGSNAIGTFYPFIKDDVALYGVEAAGQGEDTDKHALAIGKGSPGVLHGTKMYLIQDEGGQVQLAHSISAGLDYPGIGPEHSYYHDIGRVTFENASDTQAMNALINFTKHEGIIPAIESAHALSYVERLAPTMSKEDIIVVTISGRGDKDMETIRQYMAERGLAND
ncbi:TPA: tryptophan synthase subunit beta [Staphylococcus aureus]|nr:tryptophan synthase subunit beta [Staphylococcus aureus]